MSEHGYRIRVTRNGPYEVTGGAPLVRTAQVETPHGEPVDWEAPTPIETRAEFELCRCGLSSRKPFCDASHEAANFDGTEVADRRQRSERAKAFVGDHVVMTDDRSLCSRAGYCVDRSTDVWVMIDQTSDPVIRARLRRMVELCPSGRLDHSPAAVVAAVEPFFEPSIAAVRDGPLWVRGGIPIESSDGRTYEIRNRVTLCRCGHSNNKPFCDGTHKEVSFRSGAEDAT